MIEMFLIQKFLYATLGATALTGVYKSFKGQSKGAGKLTSTELKNHREMKTLKGDDGLKISKNIRLEEKYDFENVCLIAPTGAGKTTSLFLNNLLDNKIGGSLIVTDPKGELYELTSGYQKNVCKRKVYKIDFTDIKHSERYNILENCKDSEEVIQLASTLLMNGSLSIELVTGKKAGGVEWIQMSESLLASMLLYVYELEKPFNTIEFALQLLLTLNEKQIKFLIENSKNLSAIGQYNIFAMVAGADRTEASIKITLSTNMKLFMNKDVNSISCDSTFDIAKFREEESILYVIYPERKAPYLAPFIAPLFSQFIDKLLDVYKKGSSLPVHLFFDEFGNVGMISNMPTNVSTCRVREMGFIVCLQSLSQMKQIYGLDNSNSIMNNLKTKIVLEGVTDMDTLRYISNICGNTEVRTRSESYSGDKKTVSYSNKEVKIFDEGEIRTLESGKAIIVCSNKMPIVDKVEYYYKTDLAKNVEEEVEYKAYEMPKYDISKEVSKKQKEINEDLDSQKRKYNKKDKNNQILDDILGIG